MSENNPVPPEVTEEVPVARPALFGRQDEIEAIQARLKQEELFGGQALVVRGTTLAELIGIEMDTRQVHLTDCLSQRRETVSSCRRLRQESVHQIRSGPDRPTYFPIQPYGYWSSNWLDFGLSIPVNR